VSRIGGDGLGTLAREVEMKSGREPITTFSMVARDPQTGAIGVGVASRVLAMGAAVPWAAHDAGAIASQSWVNVTYGPRGLEMMRRGQSARETLDALLKDDSEMDDRQVGIVDLRGGLATWTGPKCQPWAGAVVGDGFAAQGNTLAGSPVLEAMVWAFQTTRGELAERLMATLEAGDASGGDTRGRQSAAILVAWAGVDYAEFDDRYIDLRVDDSPDSVSELRRLLGLKLQHIAAVSAWLRQRGSGEHRREGG
jgi:uncharacterized Ntn-hydrolase superfamily protein